MPSSPPKPCNAPGCRALIKGGAYCATHAREVRRKRDEQAGTAAERGYDWAWRKRRAAHLSGEPLCRMCLANGRVVAATVADHIVPHRGDRALFMGALQSLCVHCHSSVKQKEERQAQREERRAATEKIPRAF